MATLLRIKRGTKAQLDTAAGANGLAAGEPYLVTDQGGRLAVGTALGGYQMAQIRGISSFCSGKPAASEVVAGAEAPYALTFVVANCVAEASVAATASTTFIIKKNGVQVGTIIFAAAATLGAVSLTDTAVLLGDRITIEAPATADATLATLTFLLRE